MQVYLLRIAQFQDRKFLLNLMADWSSDLKETVMSFVQEKDVNAAFWGKYLLQKILREDGRYTWSDVAFSIKEKPYIPNADLYFNLSHSGQYVLLATDSQPIGVDIEMHRKVKIELFNRQFDEREWSIIRGASEMQKQFFDFWSIKESCIKADGRGVEVLSRTHIIDEHTLKIDEDTWYYQSFGHLEGYSMAVCSGVPFYVLNKDIQTLDTDILIQEM